MSSGVSDRSKRQSAAGKHMETYECDAIPWSQQVDEASYENLSSPTDKKKSDPKIKAYKQYYGDDNRWNEESCSEKRINSPKVSYNTKRDSTNNLQKMTSRDVHKVYLGDTTVSGNDDHKILNYPADNSSMPNDSTSNKKKITWASIASQPAKPNKKSNSTLLKKKGPGMPPPPMIPGKHNLDINAWEPSISSADVSGSVSISSIPVNEHANLVEDETRQCRTTTEQQSNFSRKQLNFYSNKPLKIMKGNSRINDISRDKRYIQKHTEEQNQNIRKTNTNCMYRETGESECNEVNVYEEPNFSKTEPPQSETNDLSHIVLKKLKDRNNYNPADIDMQKAALSRFFVIKSYSEDDIHRSIKYEIWCSTDHGNKRLDEAFKERVKEGGHVMLFFSVNGSGHFCGMAQMMTSVDYNSISSVWSQDKWKGKFKVKWIYVKDVPNSQLRHIRLENNDNKSVTNSRDTQEVPNGKGIQVLRVLHLYKHQTSIFDDFYHYEKKQEESVLKKPQFDSYIHPSSSNVCHNEIKEQNADRFSGNFRDRIVSHRGHHNFIGTRRSDKLVETHHGKHEKEKQQIINSLNHDRGDNETDAHSFQRHKISGSENCSSSNSKRNFKDIILHMNNFNCNENSIALENSEAKLL